MNTIKIKFFNTILSIWLVLCTGCESFIEVPLPDTELSTPLVFEDVATAEAAITSIYASIRDEGLLTGKISGISHQLGVYSDELTYYGPTENLSYDFFLNTLSASDTRLITLWEASYKQLYTTNSALKGIESSDSLTEDQKSGLMGEVLFIRAVVHFYLVNLYGPVPYVTTTDYDQNSQLTRTDINSVYQHLIDDLKTAITILPVAYKFEDRTRPNRATAQALLARIYLFNGNWQEASDMASAILNQTGLFTLENPEQTFLKDCRSTIWQLAPSQQGYNTHEGSTFPFTSGPPPQSGLNEDLVSSFPQGDLRKISWTDEISDGTQTWHAPYKYKLNLYEGSGTEYSKVFRLAEIYLIRAEARAQFGDLIGAVEDINRIRNRAGLSGTSAVTRDTILKEIYLQYRLELFTEHGHRFFDLKRTGRLDQVLSVIKPGWNTSDSLWPVPESEISLNPNLLPQNPGY